MANEGSGGAGMNTRESINGGKKGEKRKEVLKKGQWTLEEDRVLMQYVMVYGESNWNAVARNSGLVRSGKSCRLRWTNHLRPNLKKGDFTAQEERQIVILHAMLGNQWSVMATYVHGRTDNEIKNFWNTRAKRHKRAGIPLYHLNSWSSLFQNPNFHPSHLTIYNPLAVTSMNAPSHNLLPSTHELCSRGNVSLLSDKFGESETLQIENTNTVDLPIFKVADSKITTENSLEVSSTRHSSILEVGINREKLDEFEDPIDMLTVDEMSNLLNSISEPISDCNADEFEDLTNWLTEEEMSNLLMSPVAEPISYCQTEKNDEMFESQMNLFTEDEMSISVLDFPISEPIVDCFVDVNDDSSTANGNMGTAMEIEPEVLCSTVAAPNDELDGEPYFWNNMPGVW